MSTPAIEIRSFPVTVPAGTPQSAPLITSIAFPPRVVTEIHWRVPPGSAGTFGWKLTMSNGQAVLPTNGTFIVTDNQADVWPVVDQPDSGEWEVTAYNTDIYPHTVYLDFFLQVVGNATEVTTYYSNAALSSPSSITTPPPITVPAITTPGPITTPAPITIPAITTPAFITTPPPVTTPVPVSSG